MRRINEIIDAVKEYHPKADVNSIMKAYVYSAKVHAGQLRRSGENYLSHPLEVAGLLSDMHLDVASICAGLLHDTVEDTQATKADIENLMGGEIANLVDGVTKITLLSTTDTARQAQTLRKMILAMANDIRVLLVKLADRLHNMRTLGWLKESKQQSVARETRDIYAPMAHRLGIRRWQAELEDLALFYLDSKAYQHIKEGVASKKSDRQKFTTTVMSLIKKAVNDEGISCRVYGRSKHFASIFNKMKRNNLDVDGLYDLIAFRVIVDTQPDCYEALGVIHNVFKPIPGRFRDYVGMPKPNMYQSLHTSVVGPEGQRMEVQIRTEEMHRVAEEGIAAHWQYKEAGADDEEEKERFTWLRRLLEWQREPTDPSEFMQSLRMDLYPESIFVFTPGGDVKEMPKGATPVDFAYSIHSEVGDQCTGAKVNDRIVALKTQLNTGDQVEIITKTNHRPSKDWLKFVVTSRARQKIRSYIRESERSRAVSMGHDLLERELKKKHLNLNTIIKEGRLDHIAADFSFKDIDHILAAISYGKISPKLVMHRLLPKNEKEGIKEGILSRPLRRLRKRPPGGVKVKGVDDILVRFAKCCNPLPGDAIAGYITRGRGITVHQTGCPHLDKVDPERRVDLEWDVPEGETRPARIQAYGHNRSGLLADLTGVLKQQEIEIVEAEAHIGEDQQAVATFVIQVGDTHQLNGLLQRMRRIQGVHQVIRVGLE